MSLQPTCRYYFEDIAIPDGFLYIHIDGVAGCLLEVSAQELPSYQESPLMSLFKDRLAGKSGGKILDVATAGGWFIDELMKSFKDIDRAIGVDIADEEFDDACRRFEGRPISFVVMDGATLKFADESFDAVAMAAGMHHLDDIPAVLSEMMRVLKSGGTFILREVYRDDLNEKQVTDVMAHDWGAKVDRLLGKPHYPSLTRQEIIDHVNALSLSRFETGLHLCEDCPRSRGETIEKEIAELNDQLAEVKGLVQYDELKAELDPIVDRFRTIGVSCQASVDILGIK